MSRIRCSGGIQIHSVPLFQPAVRGRRLGTAVLFSGKAGVWRLVPSYQMGCGTVFEWDEARPESFNTKREAMAARKELRAKGELP